MSNLGLDQTIRHVKLLMLPACNPDVTSLRRSIQLKFYLLILARI